MKGFRDCDDSTNGEFWMSMCLTSWSVCQHIVTLDMKCELAKFTTSGGDLCWRLGDAPSPEKISFFELEKVSFGAF